MGNSRGNVYSRGNLYYDTTQAQLWAFSYDEMAQYDLPAIYDLILAETGVDQLIHVGHSQGTAQAFAAYSTYPETASKVKLFIALAPIVYLTYQESLLLSTFAQLPDSVVFDLLGDLAFPPDTTWFNTLETYFPDVCVDFPWACESAIFLLGGCNNIRTCDPGNMNQSRTEVYAAHIGGGSVQDLVHFLQATRSTTFPMYNYDSSSANLAHYNSSTPPNYDVTKMTVPTALFYGGRDGFADETDVDRLIPQLQSLVFTHYEPDYEHLDFVWGMNAYEKIYNLIIELVNKYW
jgi:pimeloyl-ACP methyl ester carboxylesterase